MTTRRRALTLAPAGVAGLVGAILLAAFASLTPAAAERPAAGREQPAAADACVALTGPGQIPSPTVITFDELAAGTSIGSFYQPAHGVRFEESRTARVIAYDHPLPRSAPMAAMSETDGDPSATALNFYFDAPRASVGLFAGNGGGATAARLEGFDADGNLICTAEAANVVDGHTTFLGFSDESGRIVSASLTYLSAQAESMDDLHFSDAASPPNPSSGALFVYPAQVAPGGRPRVSGYGFPALADLQLVLACPDARAELELGMARTDEAGRLRTTITLPAYPPNPCSLSARQQATVLAETALTIVPALELVFSPQEGPPGTEVGFTVRNLVAGSLRMDYAGAAVVGPVAVADGNYAGHFTVPRDRPNPLGSSTTLRVTNLIAGIVVAQAESSFLSQEESPRPPYRVMNLQMPIAGVKPGGSFDITGTISPAPMPGQVTIQPVWKTTSGKIFPVGTGPAQIGGDGSFRAPARVPGLKAGDPFLPQDGDQVGVALVATDGQVLANLLETGNLWLYPGLDVRAVVQGSSPAQEIAGAVITVSDWPGSVSAGSVSQQANAIFSGPVNQIAGSNSDDGELTDEEKMAVELQKAACPIIGIPVNSTDLVISVVGPPLEENLSQPAGLSQMLTNTQLVLPGATGAALAGADGAPAPTASPDAGTVLHYLVTVDGIAKGYGFLDEGTKLPRTTSFRVDYHMADQTYRDEKGNLLPSPLLVALPPIPEWAKGQLGEIKAFFEDLTPDIQTTPGGTPVFSRYYSLAGVPANVPKPPSTSARILAVLSVAQRALLATNGLKLYVDGAFKGNFELQFNSGVVCTMLKGPKVVSNPFYVATFSLVNPHLLAPGLHDVRIGATLAADPTKEISYSYKLKVDGLPPGWFAVQNQGTRSIEWRTLGVRFYDGWLSEAASSQTLASDATTETDETGVLENNTRANVTVLHEAYANGNKASLTTGQGKGKALNKDGSGANVGASASAAGSGVSAADLAPDAQPAGSGVTKSIGPKTDTLVPTITFDLPEARYGIPFVAEVVAGGSVSYSASITYGGTITVQEDGSVQSVLTIDPESTVSGTVYVEGRLLSGLIGKAGASLTADFNLHMPVTYDTAKSKPVTSDTYFKYSATFKAWHKWGCVPYAGCAYSKSYTTPLFNGCKDLEGSSVCPAAALMGASGSSGQAETAALPAEPAQVDMDLATNGMGTLMSIWPASLTSLATRTFDGTSWTPPQVISTGVGSSDPHVAFLAPGKALAVWVETTLPPGQGDAFYASIPITDAVKSQRLAYASWDGSGWSAAAPLTTPLHGEGNVVLAACTDDPACPAGGAVTAVWQRYVTADPLQRQIRLYYATYQSGAWSAALPVDPSSTATDILPQVAYRGGIPLVAWVRDSDTDMKDVTSRRVAVRSLNGGAVTLPPELPGAIGEISLAVGKNGQPMLAFTVAEDGARLLDTRRPLWFAAGSCTGSSCTWTPVQQRDPFGRPLYAERPTLTLNGLDQPTITFRGLGFGPDLAGQMLTKPGDPPGMAFATGELVQLAPNPVTGIGAPMYLTQDGAVNWLPVAVFDPVSNGVQSLVVKGSASMAQAAGNGLRNASPDPDLPVSFTIVPGLPDFAMISAEPSRRFPLPDEQLSITVKVSNQGTPWNASGNGPLAVTATWDGGPGVGSPAGERSLTDLNGGVIEFTMHLARPAGSLDVVHSLIITVNPGQAIVESDAANNTLSIEMGGVPVPEGLVASSKAGSGLVFLQWTPAADPRIAGYRVYRAAGAGSVVTTGSSLTHGWVDPGAVAGTTYRYAVAAYTAAGVESGLGEAVEVVVGVVVDRRTYLPLARR